MRVRDFPRGGAREAALALALLLSLAFDLAAQGIGGRPGSPNETPLTIARLRYAPGDWYANPTSLTNLLAFVREGLGLPTAGREAVVRATDPDLDRYPLLYLTGHGEIRLTGEEVAALRRYLASGGMLHADDNFGIDPSLRREIGRIFPDEPLVELPADHSIYHAAYDFPQGLPKIHEHAGGPPHGFGVFYDGRLVIFYSFNTDLGDGWEDPAVHGDPPVVRAAALRMGANVLAYALTH
ncbi:MAG TPA: DUF4159 domain-containing protein [Gemmatimonadota bacterium]|nr:DUF4159 domain-containing protein [Gemmatimonadota bacterium]